MSQLVVTSVPSFISKSFSFLFISLTLMMTTFQRSSVRSQVMFINVKVLKTFVQHVTST